MRVFLDFMLKNEDKKERKFELQICLLVCMGVS